MVHTIKFSEFDDLNLNNQTNTMVGISDPTGGSNIKTDFTTAWTTTGRPTMAYEGLQGYNSTLGVPEYWDGFGWIQLSGGGGSVVQINTGTGLTGGPITTAGTISFAQIAAMSLWANVTGSLATPAVVPLTDFLLSANNLDDLTDTQLARFNLFLAADTGNPGQVLTSNGVIDPPTWEDAVGGNVGFGNINELAYYQAAGNSVDGLTTHPLGVLVTDASGVPSISSGGQIPGTTTNNNANAGNIGEAVDATRLYASSLSMTSTVPINVVSVLLQPGDWQVSGNVFIDPSISATSYSGAISVTSASYPDNCFLTGSSGISFTDNGFSTSTIRVSTNITITVYLVASATFASGTCIVCGYMLARRMR